MEGDTLTIEPDSAPAMAFKFHFTPQGALVLRTADGSAMTLTRPGEERRDPLPPPPAPGPLVPDWAKPGYRMTYYMMTGQLAGSVNGWVADEEGEWEDKETKKRYARERVGRSSQGLLQVTIAAIDKQFVVLAEPFYLFADEMRTPVLTSHMDMLGSLETGGDFWMHPQVQARLRESNPWTKDKPPPAGQMVARAAQWTAANQTFDATTITVEGDGYRTFFAFDQASGRMLSLRRLLRQAPDVRDRTGTLPDSVSHATFIEFLGARQLDLPWLAAPPPEWTPRVQSFSYRGQTGMQGEGIVPTPSPVAEEVLVERRGADWLFVRGRSAMQGAVAEGGFTAVSGPGSLPPVGIAPEVLARLKVGQEIDRDPFTGFTMRVGHVDGQVVGLVTEGPLQSFGYYFDRQQGFLVRRVSHSRQPNVPGMVMVNDVQLTAWR
ncbi:MAG: hypothetical protein MUE73_02745 [Planctomycetes bacterium]|nr:hypothetical protein [Planctomycetota bacterium]